VRRFLTPADRFAGRDLGISLIMTQGALLLLGSGAPGVGTRSQRVARQCVILHLPAGAVRDRRLLLVGLYLLFMKTALLAATPGRPCRMPRWPERSASGPGIYSVTFGLERLRRPLRRPLCADHDAQPQ